MNRKIYLLLTVLLAWSFNLKAQTAQIESITANPGSAVSFNLDIAGLPTNVGAVSLFIGYDPNVLTFSGSSLGDPDFSGYFINNMVGSHQIGIQWTNPAGADINGTLLTLNFQYNTLGGSCDLTFDAGCEFTDINLEPVLLTYTNGSIGPNAGIATITIDELLATAGPVTLGVTGAGFDQNIAAMTLYIHFDPSVMQYTGFTSSLTAILVSGNNTQGTISVAYTNIPGQPINSTFLNLNFNYDGTGSSDLVFTGGCEVAYNDLTTPVVSYDNGLIEPAASAYSLTIGDLVTTPGGIVNIPITAAGYNPNLMGAITLYIGFNPAHMDFLNVTGGTINGISANLIGPGFVGITWTNPTGALIDGTLLTMNFNYNFGSSAITFDGGCEIVDNNLEFFPTTFIDGSIAPVLGGPEISMPIQTGTITQTVDFPLTVKNFIMDVGAISLFIGYDDNVLTYTGNTPGTLTNYFINNMVGTSQVGIQWTDISGLDIDPNNDDVLLTLHFTYNGGSCPLTFDGGCDFAQPDLSFIPVAYFDGALITGTLFNLKAYLEGPWNGTSMNANINAEGFLPLTQPYGVTPWNYAGAEAVDAIPNENVVDWVLLEFRHTSAGPETATADSVVARQVAFILSDGSVVDLDGESNVLVPTSFEDDLYIVIYHRNHIPVMSATAMTQVNGIYTYDFTTAQSQAYGDGQKVLTGGNGMYAADGNGDGQVSNYDLFFVWMPQVGLQGYYGGDFDLNTQVQNFDLFFRWMPNVGMGSQVP
jgi:hypothetical protein